MAYKIIRNKRYLSSLISVLSYLETENGSDISIAFLLLIEKKESILTKHPLIGAPTGIRDTRSLHITPHNRLFYRVRGHHLIFLNLYDTRKKNYRSPGKG